MEESNHASSSTGNVAPSISPRQSFRFPGRDQFSDRQGSSGGESLPRSLDISSVGRKAGSDQSPLRTDVRRRVRSVDVETNRDDYHRSIGRAESSRSGANRLTITRNSPKDKGPAELNVTDEFGSTSFSDEYDLSQDDPRILQDVQRALNLRARRESRLKNMQSQSPLKGGGSKSANASRASSTHASSSPTQTTFPPGTNPFASTRSSSEIDFSPSVGLVPLHPVPTTSDNGATLDWTSSTSDNEKSERRWTMSISKRKDKEKPPAPSIVEKHVVIHNEKLVRIKSKASPQTLRKANITRNQLQRRYTLVYNSLLPSHRPFNLAAVARWYRTQDQQIRSSIDAVEPLTWLKHLLDKRGANLSTRSPWHLSALIAEEYVKRQMRSDAMATIPEVPSPDGLSPTDQSPTSQSLGPALSPQRTRASSHYSLGPTFSKSLDGHVSFEPLVDSARSSVDDTRRNADGPSRAYRYSLPANTTSPHSSIQSIFSGSSNYHPPHIVSPASSRLHLRDLATRLGRRRRGNDSDGASSSARDSLSEEPSRSDDGAVGRYRKRGVRPPELEPESSGRQSADRERVVRSGDRSDPERTANSSLQVPHTAKHQRPFLSDGESTAMLRPPWQSSQSPATPTPRIVSRGRDRASLPTADQLVLGEQKRQQEADEEKERYEYDHKAMVLDDLIAQNRRVRVLLQRIAAGVRECEMLESGLMKFLGLPHRGIPPELIEAFSHDPSAVTGATRRFQGWRAVEDIHNRIRRQRDTFRLFLSVAQEGGVFSSPQNVLDDPIKSLGSALEKLEVHQRDVTKRAHEVAEVLAKVKSVHAVVKSEYNDTLSHTSVVYPELSHIVGLEESYKDQYQQFWELGMDALTLLLDTVTPFWRNYGKTIGEDVQDFLVVPLYRNEFTGEPKRYKIKHLPRRSMRHWLGLHLFSLITAVVTFLQTRAAVQSMAYYRLDFIGHPGLWWTAMPFFWIGIFIQWCAVAIEFCICFAELGVVVWWLGWSVKIFN